MHNMDCCVCYVFVCLVKSWKIGHGFVQEKKFVIKLLKILKCKNCSVQATT